MDLFAQWIEKGVFDAIEKQYLKSMSLIVARVPDGADVLKYTNELGDDVVENYTFKYEYSDKGDCMLNTGDGEPTVCTKANSKNDRSHDVFMRIHDRTMCSCAPT